MTCDWGHRWVDVTRYTSDVVDRKGSEDETSYDHVTVECMSCSEKLGRRQDGEWTKATPRWVRDLVEGASYVVATTLKGSAQEDAPNHAVPEDEPVHSARSVCGVQELAVFLSGGERQPFDPGSAYACQRCVKILGGAP